MCGINPSTFEGFCMICKYDKQGFSRKLDQGGKSGFPKIEGGQQQLAVIQLNFENCLILSLHPFMHIASAGVMVL
jgi:hypothetical protein